MIHLGDITKIGGLDIEPVDLITGGSPCQDLSIAGKREGLSGSRSGLFREQIRVIMEMRMATLAESPRFMVWENVPGALTSNGGRDFAEVLNECIKIAEQKPVPLLHVPAKGWPGAGCVWDELGGWSIAWRIHDAQFWGVPQRRRRIALVCDFGGLSAAKILFEREGVRGGTEAGKEKRELFADRSFERIGDTIYDCRGNGDGLTCPTRTGDHESRVADHTAIVREGAFGVNTHTLGCTTREAVVSIANGQRNSSAIYDCAHTLACMHDHETIVTKSTVRRLTPLECERLQGFPDGWTDIGDWVDSRGKPRKAADTPRYRALGNSIALPFWRWLLRRIYAELGGRRKKPSLGSLFDGIGGFPLCWPGRTAWASEIDEFCIAVTEKRFNRGQQRGFCGSTDI